MSAAAVQIMSAAPLPGTHNITAVLTSYLSGKQSNLPCRKRLCPLLDHLLHRIPKSFINDGFMCVFYADPLLFRYWFIFLRLIRNTSISSLYEISDIHFITQYISNGKILPQSSSLMPRRFLYNAFSPFIFCGIRDPLPVEHSGDGCFPHAICK